ncbi:unnamed protein product [Larinioides sclopetarius]|uniref:NR LBD domain-containing protein n=1 Tax=Larinioides sclopetarius TaxID=280406 RepID=A0AAV2BRA1_9ARAC
MHMLQVGANAEIDSSSKIKVVYVGGILPMKRMAEEGMGEVGSDEEFINNFRLSKTLAFQLIEEIKPFLEPKTTRRDALSTEIKVLCALNFFAFASYQKKVGNDLPILMSWGSFSHSIREVSEAMSKNLLQKYVKFPDDQSAQKTVKEEFFKCCGLEGV